MTENDLIELYSIVDDFYQKFVETKAEKRNLALYYGRRGPKKRMSGPDVMTLNLLRIFVRTGDLKTFHKLAVVNYRHCFPDYHRISSLYSLLQQEELQREYLLPGFDTCYRLRKQVYIIT